MKSFKEFMESLQLETIYSWDIEFFDLPINESKKKSVIGTIIDAKNHPLYKERDKPDQELASDEEYHKAYSAYKSEHPDDEAKERTPLTTGKRIGVRLNLNATASAKKRGYPNVKVLTAHDSKAKSQQKETNAYTHNTGFAKNPVIANMHVATLRNAYFNVNQTERSHIANKIQNLDVPAAQKRNKNPMASVDGEFLEQKPNFSGVVARFNPANHHLFVDENGHAIRSAEEVTLHGDRAYLRGKIEYHTPETAPEKKGNSTSETKFKPQE